MSVLQALPNLQLQDIQPQKQDFSDKKELTKSIDENSSFNKLFNEKKQHNETTATKNREEQSVEPQAKTAKKNDKDLSTIRKVLVALKQAKKSETASPLKEIFSALIDKSKMNIPSDDREKKKAQAKKISRSELFALNNLFVSGNTQQAKKKWIGTKTGENALAKTEGVKKNRQIVVIDLRTKKAEPKTEKVSSKNTAQNAAKKIDPLQPKKIMETKDAPDIKLFTRAQAEADVVSTPRNYSQTGQTVVKSDLSLRFGEQMKNEMVRHTGIIVKDGGAGEIQLVLKPDSLGSVRIKMNIEDNHIVGKIIVDNNTVKEIMEENLADLENALKDNGYENPRFDVYLAGERRDQAQDNSSFASLLTGEDNALENVLSEYEGAQASVYDDGVVNIVV